MSDELEIEYSKEALAGMARLYSSVRGTEKVRVCLQCGKNVPPTKANTRRKICLNCGHSSSGDPCPVIHRTTSYGLGIQSDSQTYQKRRT